MRALLEAQQAGKIRYIGFTGHKDPHIHLHMLEVAEEHGFTFDTVQMPLNVMDAHFRSFEQHGASGARAAEDRRPRDEVASPTGVILSRAPSAPIECLHYALNLPTSVVITGCDSSRSSTRHSRRRGRSGR